METSYFTIIFPEDRRFESSTPLSFQFQILSIYKSIVCPRLEYTSRVSKGSTYTYIPFGECQVRKPLDSSSHLLILKVSTSETVTVFSPFSIDIYLHAGRSSEFARPYRCHAADDFPLFPTTYTIQISR